MQVHGIISCCNGGAAQKLGLLQDSPSTQLIAALPLGQLPSLQAFADAWWCHDINQAQFQREALAAAHLQALAYLTSPEATEILGMAQLMFRQMAGGSVTALQNRLDPLVRSTGAGGPQMALELCCFGALSADWEGMTARLMRSCRDSVEGSATAAQSTAHSSSTACLPLHFSGAPSMLLSAAAALPQGTTALPRKQKERSEEAGQLPPAKKPRRCSAVAGHSHPVQASSNANAEQRLAALIISGRGLDPFCSAPESGSQAAALAMHPALISEVARTSFTVCRAYLSALLKAAASSESMDKALAGLVHLLRLGGLPRNLTETALHTRAGHHSADV